MKLMSSFKTTLQQCTVYTVHTKFQGRKPGSCELILLKACRIKLQIEISGNFKITPKRGRGSTIVFFKWGLNKVHYNGYFVALFRRIFGKKILKNNKRVAVYLIHLFQNFEIKSGALRP